MLVNAAILANPIVLIIALIVAAAILVYIYWEPISEFFIQLWEGIKVAAVSMWDSLKETWEFAVSGLKESWADVVEFFVGLWDSIKNVFITVYDFLNGITGGAFGAYVAIVMSYMTLMWNNIKAVWDYVKNTFLNILAFLKALVTGDFQGMKDAAVAQMKNMLNLVTTVLGNIKTMFSTILSTVLNFVREKFTGMVSAVREKMVEILNKTKENWNLVKSFFSTILSGLVTTVKTKFTDMVSRVKEKMTDVLNRVKDGWNDAKSFLTNIDLAQIGKDIIQGLINGIKSKVAAIGTAVKEVTDKITGKLKSILRIESPSKITTELGEFTGEGVEVGLVKSAKNVAKAAGKVAQSAIPDISGFTNKLRGAKAPLIDVGHSIDGSYSAKRSNENNKSNGLVAILTKQNNILTQILSKDPSFYVDGEEFAKVVNQKNAQGNIGMFF